MARRVTNTALGTAAHRRIEPGLLSAIVVNYEGGELLLACVSSLFEQDTRLEVIVVDNGSTDGSTDVVLGRFPDVRVVRPNANLGFAGGANAGAGWAGGEFLLFLNPDVELRSGCVGALLRELRDPRVGVCGPAVRVLASGSLDYGGTIDPLGHPVGLPEMSAPLYVPGCALATRTSIFQALGGFDDRYFMFVEDVDYCLRVLLAGWDVRVAAGALAAHVGGAAAPGGYPTPSGLHTTRMRVVLRERNMLATIVKCYSPSSLALVLPTYVLQVLLTAAALGLSGKIRTAREVVGTLVWNARQLGTTLSLRREVQARRRVSDRMLRRRMWPRLRKVELLARYGMPAVRES